MGCAHVVQKFCGERASAAILAVKNNVRKFLLLNAFSKLEYAQPNKTLFGVGFEMFQRFGLFKVLSVFQIDAAWLSGHAVEIAHMLPGGIDVVGVFIIAPANENGEFKANAKEVGADSLLLCNNLSGVLC